jgi:hypothetical protein
VEGPRELLAKIALERMARRRSGPARVVERAQIVFLAIEGLENRQTAVRMTITPEKRHGGGAAFGQRASRPCSGMRHGRAERAPLPIAT